MHQLSTPTNTYHSPFMANYFCIMEKYQAAFIAISKNAVTYLKNIVIYSKENMIPKTEEKTHEYIGFTPHNGFLIPVSEMPQYERVHGKILKFAVWRDPVQRLLSTYKWFILEKHPRFYFNIWLDFHQDCSFERFVEFVKFELGKKRILAQDEHIRKQSDYYSFFDVDYIVPIENLNHFLAEHHIPVLAEKSNESQKYNIEINKTVMDEIQNLYLNDYQLFNNATNVYHYVENL